jgi:hypothetical protein
MAGKKTRNVEGGKEEAGKNKRERSWQEKRERTSWKNERERIGGKEVCWRNRAGKKFAGKNLLKITSGNGVGGK